ncbi:MAG: hypothetical protein M3318_01065 [Actinomycetota bacterium]|nr:hypothetical protein [Actinomycetota bacterium]
MLDAEVAYMDTGEGFMEIILRSAVLQEFTEEGRFAAPLCIGEPPHEIGEAVAAFVARTRR